MAYHIQKTIQFNDTDLIVYYKETTDKHHHVWTDSCEECRSFSAEGDAISMSRTIPEQTRVLENG